MSLVLFNIVLYIGYRISPPDVYEVM